jgi:hypothetical protein
MTDQAGAASARNESAPFRAQQFWEAGLRVFPLYGFLSDSTGRAARCLCGWSECKAPGKHPVASNWQHTPPWDPDQMDAMVTYNQFDSGFGVLCRGLLVIDIDARNGGIASFARLSKLVPEIAGAGLIVETGSGGGSRHFYFRAPAEGVALLQHLPDYPGLDFKSSGFVVGPGSRHASGGAYRVAYGSVDDIDAAPAGLIEILARPERHRSEFDGRVVDVSFDDIEGMLAHIPNTDLDYEIWIRIGMAIHHATGGAGQALWVEWSRTSSKHDERIMDYKWHSFGRSSNPVTLGTLVHHAEEGGWKQPVTFGDEAGQPVFERQDRQEQASGLPFSVAGVDLTCPPGFVGEVASWIEAQSRRPRRKLAVAGALTAIGNIAGLRYTDDIDGVTANLFTFCVAGSRTGKEAVQQGVAEIHRVAGCGPATHGAIKSEQEIIRNLTRHQAAFYIVDEVGIFLQKIRNAQKRGGAIYLDGVIGILMSAYSKADGFMLLSGDLKDEIKALLVKELAAIKRRIEESDGGSTIGLERRQGDLERALGMIDNGLERPYVSLIGFTTPVTFDDLVDYQSATNGFIGRSLIFQERDTAPRSKPSFVRSKMAPAMAATLSQIYSAGEYDMLADSAGARVEYYGDRTKIPTDAKAVQMLAEALHWFEDAAIAHKSKTGLEALYLGAYEIVSKVSLILAIPEGRRTTEHVRWAFELVRQDIDSKARLVVANDSEKSAPKDSLMARLANIIEDDGETIGTIVNKLRKYKREDVVKALDEMVSAGVALKTEIAAAKRQKATTHYRLTDNK